MGKNILAVLLLGFVSLSAHADSFAVEQKSKNSIPTEAEFFAECIKESKYTYLPLPGEKQESVDRKIAELKARVYAECKCSVPLEYALIKEVIGNDLDAFTVRMQADRSFATATTKTIMDRKAQIYKACLPK